MKIFLIVYGIITVLFFIYLMIKNRSKHSFLVQIITIALCSLLWPFTLLIGIVFCFIGMKSMVNSIDFEELNKVLKDIPKEDIENIIEQELRKQLENIDND